MADKAPPEAMIDEPRVAVRATEAEAATAAKCQRRVSAAVEEEQRLLAAADPGLHGLCQSWCDEAAALGRFDAQINGLDDRKVGRAKALRQRKPTVTVSPGVDLGLY